MSERKEAWTPGPWRCEALKDGWHIVSDGVERDSNGGDSTVCGGEADYDPLWLKEPEPANAHLIAAAPDLYEALERCEQMVSAAAGPPDWDWVRSVLKKARGETP